MLHCNFPILTSGQPGAFLFFPAAEIHPTWEDEAYSGIWLMLRNMVWWVWLEAECVASSSFPQASLVESASLIVPGREPVSRKAPDQGPHICEAVLTQRAVYSTPAYSTSFSPPSYAYCTPETVLCLFLHVGETCDAAKGSCCMLQTQSTQDARGLCLLFPFFFFFCSVPLSFFFFFNL